MSIWCRSRHHAEACALGGYGIRSSQFPRIVIATAGKPADLGGPSGFSPGVATKASGHPPLPTFSRYSCEDLRPREERVPISACLKPVQKRHQPESPPVVAMPPMFAEAIATGSNDLVDFDWTSTFVFRPDSRFDLNDGRPAVNRCGDPSGAGTIEETMGRVVRGRDFLRNVSRQIDPSYAGFGPVLLRPEPVRKSHLAVQLPASCLPGLLFRRWNRTVLRWPGSVHQTCS